MPAASCRRLVPATPSRPPGGLHPPGGSSAPPEGERSGRTRAVPAAVHRRSGTTSLGGLSVDCSSPRRLDHPARPPGLDTAGPATRPHEVPGHGGQPPARPDPPPPTIGRRLFLAGTAGAAAVLATQRVAGAWATPGAWPEDPFTRGVAPATRPPPGSCSGPAWPPARRSPTAACPRPVQVDWEVATGLRLPNVVTKGRTMASPALGHAVHVEVEASTRAATTGTGSGPAAT